MPKEGLAIVGWRRVEPTVGPPLRRLLGPVVNVLMTPVRRSAAVLLLAHLRRDRMLTQQFPARSTLTYAEWLQLTPAARSAVESGPLVVANAIGNERHVVWTIESIADTGSQRAVPFLVDLWMHCPLEMTRGAAGRALLKLGGQQALDALVAMADDFHSASGDLAAQARLASDPRSAYDYCEAALLRARAGDRNAEREVECLLAHQVRTRWKRQNGRFVGTSSAPYAAVDPRWFDLAARARRDRVFGEVARELLGLLPADERAAVVRRWPFERPAVPRRHGVIVRGKLLRRYLAGEYQAVWRELEELGPLAQGAEREEALEVALETMRRADLAIRELTGRLRARGYPLVREPLGPLVPASRVADLERICEGPIPPALTAFWTTIGGVDFAPPQLKDEPEARWPDWWPDEVRVEYVDPLVVDPLPTSWYEVEDWQRRRREADPDMVGPLELAIAPDRYHKMDISGGAPYSVELPAETADVTIRDMPGEPMLVPYLRDAVRTGGFPGLILAPGPRPRWDALVAELTRGLEPF